MKRVLFFLLLIAEACSDDEKSVDNRQYITIAPHNSDNELYANVPIQFNVQVGPAEAVTGATWEFGDGEVSTNPSVAPQHYYSQPSTYTVTVNITTNKRSFTRDSTITIIPPPLTIGSASTGERGRRVHRTGAGRFAILYEVTNNTSIVRSKLLGIDSQLHPDVQPVDLELGSYENVGRSAIAADGKLCIIVGTNLLVYSIDGVKQKTYYITRYGRDIRIEGNNVSVLCDSADYTVVKTVNLTSDQITTDRQHAAIDGMVLNDLFFNKDGGIIGRYSNSTNTVTLLQGIARDGSSVFSAFFQEANFIRNATPVSSGIIINGYTVDYYPLKLVKLDNGNKVQWTNNYPMTPSFNGIYLGDETIIKEHQGYFYIFFDNMRCIKIHEESGVVWDRFFYPKTARLNAAEVNENGEIMMVGTRHFNPDTDQDTMLERDVIVVRIDTDGKRIK